MTTTIFIKSYSKDYKWLRYCLESIDRFVTGYEELVLVIPKGELKELMQVLGVRSASHTELGTWRFGYKSVYIQCWEFEEYGDPYLFQQAVKLDCHRYIKTDRVCFVDSDCVFTRNVNLSELPNQILYTPYDEVGDAQCWKAPTEKFLGRGVGYEFMRRQPFLYNTNTLTGLDNHCHSTHGCSIFDYVMKQDRFSEFNALGAFAAIYHNQDYDFIPTSEIGRAVEPYVYQAWSHSGLTKEDLRKIYEILYPEIEFTPEGHAIVRGDTHIGEWVKENRRLDFDLSATPKFLEHVSDGSVVVDCGANIGAYSKAFLDKVGPKGVVICVEPNPVTFKALEYNLWGYENVVLIQAALGMSEGVATFTTTPNTGGSYVDLQGNIEVQVIALDDIIETYEISKVDLIKIDCEGTEEFVLRGGSKTIYRDNPDLIVEINDGACRRYESSAKEVLDILNTFGYTYKNIYDGEPCEGQQYDIICKSDFKPVDVSKEVQTFIDNNVKQPVISFKHMGNAGDIIYALSGIKSLCRKLGAKARIYIWLNRPAHYYDGAIHPTRDFKGRQVAMNHYMFKMIKPLLEEVEFVDSVEIFEGQEIDVDLDQTHEHNVNKPYGDIRRWYSYIFHGMQCDLSEKILHSTPYNVTEPYILVNRTMRYRNPMGSYAFLGRVGVENGMDIIFAGSPDEYEEFLTEVPTAKQLEVQDFSVLAKWIAGARVFIGNQSMCFAIAEQLKTRRIMEICRFAPNVIPNGGECWDWLTQSGFELAVKEAVKK